MKLKDRGEPVIRVQRALNIVQDRNPPMIADGDYGNGTLAAINKWKTMIGAPVPTSGDKGEFDDAQQARLFEMARAKGWVENPQPGGPAPWLEHGRLELGVKEIEGIAAEPRILNYIATFPGLSAITSKQGVPMGSTDETPWCACFTNWCLLRAGQRRGPSAAARDWLTFGVECGRRPGAIIVLFNAKASASTTASGFHVAFYTGDTAKGVRLLGGNQGNVVSEVEFQTPADPKKGWEVKGLRWPV